MSVAWQPPVASHQCCTVDMPALQVCQSFAVTFSINTPLHRGEHGSEDQPITANAVGQNITEAKAKHNMQSNKILHLMRVSSANYMSWMG